MDILEKTNLLYNELKMNIDALDFVQNKLNNYKLDNDEYERLYKEEFRLSMRITGAFGDLKEIIEKLKKTGTNDFLVKRMENNLAKLIKTDFIKDINNL